MTQIYAQPRVRRGLTLVEMLVATTLTLILFFSVAQIFAFLGDTMHDARSTIELSGNLRALTTTMQTDLDCHTAPGLPLVAVGANKGYFTVIEGPDRDWDFATATSMAGDADDIIAFTAYSKEQPFVGLIVGDLVKIDTNNDGAGDTLCINGSSNITPITSHYAEIIYWTEFTPFDDTDGNGVRGPHETVTLFRRVLLIRPDIDFVHVSGSWNAGTGWTWNTTRSISQLEAFNNFDLALRAYSKGTGANWQWRTNSLEDLQSRTNRHGSSMSRTSQATANNGPAALFDEPTGTPHSAPGTLIGRTLSDFPYPLRPRYLRSFEKMNEVAIETGSNITGIRDRTGEDVVMSKVLAFDVKVFDPLAPILVHAASSDIATIPGDYGFKDLDATVDVTNPKAISAGTGAYVDLNWFNFTDDPNRAPPSRPLLYTGGHFYGGPSAQSQLGGQTIPIYQYGRSPSVANARSLAIYDTWPLLYEQDGVDQDNDSLVDEGNNGIDDPYVAGNSATILNGVDDPLERETAPPYDHPLRGIQITIRAIEDGSRLIRQETVVANMTPSS
ncbi:hypothetical protein LOC68_24980 [Blastopirellula sp. JC732]|uniref:Prepilin-type N-terminal cleavage/methylation domain-containing protein n=1 Tax=Blastopirellula sediminis TaxID=2894196 RepID=A0A9X1SMG8_9BACT|nr:hypothetical protein [Blastopirellula sediminis]MCC9605036.1 hypothetical protein [Blastopirellula sediminis]MCC9631664.1 hypothetical protein [Blastopirellula sediminis]